MPSSRRILSAVLRRAEGSPPYSRMGGIMVKKKWIVILAVFLLLLGDFLYWTAELSLGKKLPEVAEDTAKVQLFYYDETFASREILVEEGDSEKILGTVAGTSVTRRPKFSTMSQPFFYLYLYYPDGYTRLLVVENGDVSLEPDMQSDKRLYFDGGEALFATLKGLMNRSPAVFPAE